MLGNLSQIASEAIREVYKFCMKPCRIYNLFSPLTTPRSTVGPQKLYSEAGDMTGYLQLSATTLLLLYLGSVQTNCGSGLIFMSTMNKFTTIN